MQNFNRLVFSMILLSILPGRPSDAAPLLSESLPDIVEKALPSVVNISSTTIMVNAVEGMEDFMFFWGIPREQKSTSLGSGFILDKDGYVITNNHVVERATEVLVTLHDKKQYQARIIGRDPKLDIALLQIRDDQKKVPSGLIFVTPGDSDKVRIAESVFAVGNPFGLQHTVTTGIISAKNRTIGMGPLDNFLQTDAAINPGNSGGPLFNLKGELIGVNTLIFSKSGHSGGLGFAVPVNEVKSVLDDLKKYGRVPRPWLGVLADKVTPPIAAHYNLPREKGVLIFNLVDGGPGERAGLQQGDIVSKANGTDLLEPLELERVLARLKPKDTLNLTVHRKSRTIELKIRLQELPPKLTGLPKGII